MYIIAVRDVVRSDAGRGEETFMASTPKELLQNIAVVETLAAKAAEWLLIIFASNHSPMCFVI